MNIAFPAVLLFLLVLPGFVFRLFVQRREVRTFDHTAFSAVALQALLCAACANLVVAAIATQWLGYRIDIVRTTPQCVSTRKTQVGSGPNDGTERDTSRDTPDDKLKRVIAATGSSILPAIIQLAVESAMRRGEIVSVRWEHIDLHDRVAHLPKTKNGESRDVPLSSKSMEALADLVPEDDEHGNDKAEDEDSRVFKIRSDAVTPAFEAGVGYRLQPSELTVASAPPPYGASRSM